MKKILIFSWMLSFVLLTFGCTSPSDGLTNTSNTLISTATNRVPATPLVTSTKKATVALTSTLLPTQQFTEIPTATATPEEQAISNCVSVNPIFLDRISLEGFIALEDIRHGITGSYLLDMNTNHRLDLPGNSERARSPLHLQVSPNRKWLAYIGLRFTNSVDFSLNIRSINGDIVNSFPSDTPEWNIFWGWQNNDWLRLVNIDSAEIDTLILLNPFTGKKKVVPHDYPDIATDDWDWQITWPTIVTYDPSLQRAVYIGEGTTSRWRLIYYDLASETKIMQVDEFGPTLSPPIWSPDGRQFIYAKEPILPFPDHYEDEFMLVDWDGSVTQITHLSNVYPNVILKTFSWSPDGNSIAFWAWTGNRDELSNRSELMVLDLRTEKVTHYCIENNNPFPLAPIWSQDSKYLAVEAIDENKNVSSVLVDFLNATASKIADSVSPVGWLYP